LLKASSEDGAVMLNANIILFSRTITNDYRWIYWDESVKAEETNIILNDYKEFETNRDFFIVNPHLIVRQLCKKIVIYYFSETQSVDQNSRKIFALQGCALSGIDFEIAKAFLPYICGYLFFERLNIYTDGIADNTSNIVKPEKISIDSVVSEYKNNNCCFTLTQRISAFTHQHPNDSFIITNDYIGLVNGTTCSAAVDSSDYVSTPQKKQYSQNINNILNGNNKDSAQHDVKRVERTRGSCLDAICSIIKKVVVK